MEDLNSAGVEPYVAAAPLPKKPPMDVLMMIIQELIIWAYVTILSIPVWFKWLQTLISGRPEKSITGQLALVTGGGNGLGKAIAIQLAKQGVNVAIADLDTSAANRVAGECRSFGVNAKAFKCDVGVFEEIKTLSREIEESLGPVDILINNAGLMPTVSLAEGKPEDIQKILTVNVTSHIWVGTVTWTESNQCVIEGMMMNGWEIER